MKLYIRCPNLLYTVLNGSIARRSSHFTNEYRVKDVYRDISSPATHIALPIRSATRPAVVGKAGTAEGTLHYQAAASKPDGVRGLRDYSRSKQVGRTRLVNREPSLACSSWTDFRTSLRCCARSVYRHGRRKEFRVECCGRDASAVVAAR